MRSAEQQVIDFLRSRHLLLVLDNAEHLLDGAELVADMLASAPKVKMLVTSRAPLRLPGEQLFPLHGLDYSGGGVGGRSGGSRPLGDFFCRLRSRVRPDYGADAAEQRNIADICRTGRRDAIGD